MLAAPLAIEWERRKQIFHEFVNVYYYVTVTMVKHHVHLIEEGMPKAEILLLLLLQLLLLFLIPFIILLPAPSSIHPPYPHPSFARFGCPPSLVTATRLGVVSGWASGDTRSVLETTTEV